MNVGNEAERRYVKNISQYSTWKTTTNLEVFKGSQDHLEEMYMNHAYTPILKKSEK